MVEFLQKRYVGYLASVIGVLTVGLILWPFYPNVGVLTAANSLLIVVLLVALQWGTTPALLTSVLGALYLNYFYVPPFSKFDFHIDGSEDIIGLIAFMATSIIVGQLSLRAHRRAREIEQLYNQLHVAFDQASQLEAIKRSEQLKSALLDTVTHDLRTPLTSIKAAATTLMRVRANDSLPAVSSRASEENLLKIIVQQSDRLNHFIEGMIELAQIESGLEENQKSTEAMAMDEIIITAIARAEDVLRNHQVLVDCDEDLNVKGTAKAIAQVLFSLLENAGKYAPVATTVRVAAHQDESMNIRIVVEDEGPGIPLSFRDKVFDKFFRGVAVEPHRNQATGLGLGLAIARGIVGAQGGKIWIEDRSDGGTGARFVFTIPAKRKVEAGVTGQAVLR